MTAFRYLRGRVYILVNVKAQRVKVGMTINNVMDRLRDVNRQWGAMKVTCQICGGKRLQDKRGLMPKHVISGNECAGGQELPLEKEIKIAISHLEYLESKLDDLAGDNKGSTSKLIYGLQKRIEKYKDYQLPVGIWEYKIAYHTECAEQVELLSHKLLSKQLDTTAPFGEVFNCSVSQASQAVESVLSELGLLQSASKEIQDESTFEEYGSCCVCGGHLTERGSCPACIRRLFH